MRTAEGQTDMAKLIVAVRIAGFKPTHIILLFITLKTP